MMTFFTLGYKMNTVSESIYCPIFLALFLGNGDRF